MKILFAASEGAPFVKSGGLGDVAGALPAALTKIPNTEVCVFLPYYESIKHNSAFQIEYVCHFYMPLAWRSTYVGIFKAVIKNRGVGKNKRNDLVYYFIDNEYYFGRNGYGYHDDGERFAFFSKAILESLYHIDFVPDIIHCNDWQTGFIPLFYKAFYARSERLSRIKTLYTIHNIEYQGKADPPFVQEVLGVDSRWQGAVMFDGLVNAMKSAIVLADRLTTVSDTYSHELKYAYFASGLECIIGQNAYKMSGIVNGIDTVSYDPAKDTKIVSPYRSADISGKAENKRHLQERLSLPVQADTPIVAIISRLVVHKGMELCEYIGERIASSGVQLVVLGTGDKRYEDYFKFLAYNYPHNVSANIYFDDGLARQIYAGADFLLMPSKSEPCGLSQMIAMRYGTLPIVRETGGLVDTVPPLNTETLEGLGFTFKCFNAHDMLEAVHRAAGFYQDRPKMERAIKSAMRVDWSWKNSAAKYMDIYRSLVE